MITSVLLGLGTSFILFIIGIYANIFTFYGIGLSGVGLSLVLFGVLKWKGIKGVQSGINPRTIGVWKYRLLMIGMGFLALYGSTGFWLDLPSYINKNYSRLEGIPTKITYEEPSSKSELEGTIIVTIQNKRLPLDPSPKYPIEHMEGHRFEIYYLPHTEWIINYKIEGLDTDIKK